MYRSGEAFCSIPRTMRCIKYWGLYFIQSMSSRAENVRSSARLHVKIQGIFIIKGNSPTMCVCVRRVRFFGRFLSGLLCCRWIEVGRAAAAQALKHYARASERPAERRWLTASATNQGRNSSLDYKYIIISHAKPAAAASSLCITNRMHAPCLSSMRWPRRRNK